MYIITALFMTILSWKYGDWLNWKKYQSTILYLIVCDLLYNFLTYNYPLWQYVASIMPTHTLNNILVIFVIYPALMLIYLSKFRSTFNLQLVHVLLWACVFSAIEWSFYKYLDLFTYHNGWNFIWSVLLNILLFTMVRLHMVRPLLTYVLSIIFTMAFLILFHIPINKMK